MAAQTVEPLQLNATVEIISTELHFMQLREEWNELLAASRADCFFLTWEWLYTWWKHLGADYSLAIRIIRIGGKLIAIAPLVRSPARPLEGRLLPTLEFLGSGFAGSDYLDIIAHPNYEHEVITALAGHLTTGLTIPLRLSNVLASDSLASKLIIALDATGWSTNSLQINVCPFITLEGHNWETYLSSLGSETRYNFNRKWKRLNRDFTVEFAAATQESLSESLGTAITQHNARWSERGGSDAFHTHELVSFHREMAAVALNRGWLRLFTLELNGAPAGSFYGFSYHSKFYFYQSGLDSTFEKHSVGFLTMGLAIQHAFAEGAREFDLLHGDERYKFHWTTEVRPLHRFETYPAGAGGTVTKGIVQLGRITRNVARHVLRSTSK